MSNLHRCLARRHSDQMICEACGLVWDVNDSEPPTCHKSERRTVRVEHADNQPLSVTKGLPDELPDDVAMEMAKAYIAACQGWIGPHGPNVHAMRAAYRVLLDRIEP